MPKNNPKTCPLKSNFAFAIIAILAVGLLLYTTIEVSNCKQDIAQINDRIQNSSLLVKVDNKSSEVNKNDSNESDQKDEDNSIENINNSKEIVYNKDGSIDTSDWDVYKNDLLGIEFKYPEEKYFIEEGGGNCDDYNSCSVAIIKKDVLVENVGINLGFKMLYTDKDAFVEEKYEKFNKLIKIKFGKNLEGEMISYKLEDIGRIHKWKKLVSFGPLKYKTVSKKVSKKDYENSDYKYYLDFIEKKCDDISFYMVIKKYPDNDIRDEIMVNCHGNDTEDAEILLNIFNSLRVYEKTIKN